jgi:hypothetical protein
MSEVAEMAADEKHYIATNVHGRCCIPQQFRARPIPKLLMAEVREEETIGFLRNHAGTSDDVHAGALIGDTSDAVILGDAGDPRRDRIPGMRAR